MTSYEIDYKSNGVLTIDVPGSSCSMCRIPYDLLRTKKHGVTPNSNFVVYLLIGRKQTGERSLYVGTSTKGIDVRPRSHEDKNSTWEQCIVFSAKPSDLCESTILHIEDRLRTMIDETVEFENETLMTKRDSANQRQKDLADKYFIPAIREVYDILGVKLKGFKVPDIKNYSESEEKILRPAIEGADFSHFKLPADMVEWFTMAESLAQEIDRDAETNVKKTYVAFKHGGLTAAYCYPLKSEKTIRVYFRGTKDWYSDPKVVARPDNIHNGDCKAEFFIRCKDDLRYFRLFLKIAMEAIDNKRKL